MERRWQLSMSASSERGKVSCVCRLPADRAEAGAPPSYPSCAYRWHHNGLMDIARLIQSAVAPVFLLSGVAVTLGVLTNRLARVVDRARLIEDRIENRPGAALSLYRDLEVLARRSRYINAAIMMSGCPRCWSRWWSFRSSPMPSSSPARRSDRDSLRRCDAVPHRGIRRLPAGSAHRHGAFALRRGEAGSSAGP